MRQSVLRISLASIAAIAFGAASTHAQSLNFDAGGPGTAPTNAFGAASMQPGFWNDLPAGVIGQPVNDLFGAPTGVTVTSSGGADFGANNNGTTGDDELLLDDLIDAPNTVTISGLNHGTYMVYTYAWAPDDMTYVTEVAVTNSPDLPQTCGGFWTGMYQLGVTYTLHTVTIDAANPDLEITFAIVTSFASFNGVQIVDPNGSGGGIGTSFCSPAVPNSTGVPGEMSAIGNPVAAGNNVTLVASSLPLNAFGFFLTSRAQGFVTNPGGSLGNLCLSGMIGRYVGPGQIKNSGAAGEISLLLDLTQTPQPMGFVAVIAGETWYFTAWHRDAVGGSAVSNFANGVEILFM